MTIKEKPSELNPETARQLDEMFDWAAERIEERDRNFQKGVQAFKKAYLTGGEEAAQEAIKHHLLDVQAENSADQNSLSETSSESKKPDPQ
jgi:hypothetical protein